MKGSRPSGPRNATGWLRGLSVLLVLALVAYLVVVRPVAINELVQQVQNLPLSLWVQLVALTMVSYAARFMRWHSFLQALGHRVPWGRQLHIYLAGFAMAVTPGKAGETVRSLYLKPLGVGYVHSVAAFLSERLLDLLTVGLLATLAIGWLPDHRTGASLAVAGCVAVVWVFRAHGLEWLARRLGAGAMGRHTAEGLAAISHLLSGRRLGLALPLSAMAWTAQGLAMHAVLLTLGHDVAATDAVAIFALGLLAGVASFLPGGVGATEAAMVLLLHTQGVGTADALTAALLSRTLPLAVGLAVGVVALGGLALKAK
ncbi:MAG: YbhN family protein [Hydrogenophaga sp.]